MASGDRGALNDLRLCFNQAQERRNTVFLMIPQGDMYIGNRIQTHRLGSDLRAIP